MQPSKTVPVSELNFAPQARHRYFRRPEALVPSRAAPGAEQDGQGGSGL